MSQCKIFKNATLSKVAFLFLCHFDWSVAEWRNLGLNVLSGEVPTSNLVATPQKNIAEILPRAALGQDDI